jgi:hypothetical protein
MKVVVVIIVALIGVTLLWHGIIKDIWKTFINFKNKNKNESV